MSEACAFTLFLFAESGIHAGTGSTLSHIDLPIQREVHTQHPVIYASGWKGALRTVFEDQWKTDPERKKVDCIFGPEKNGDAGGQGIFQEARVVLFPVRSLKGTFAWITCPLAIRRLQRDLAAIEPMLSQSAKDEVKKLLDLEIPPIQEGAALAVGNGLAIGGQIAVFEDYEYILKTEQFATTLAVWFASNALPPAQGAYQWWNDKMKRDLVVIDDEDFKHFVLMHTEVQPHVKIGQQGTVDQGPWTEEAIPADALLYANLTIPKLRNSFDALFSNGPGAAVKSVLTAVPQFQLGGNRSLGKGFVRVTCLS